ncbi:hypothetical protein O3G_MSEX003234 [Manduca sexta]|uniref:Peptidase S1 domain-containing protein n=1 Tax=Manduca sexta TaxID=7130 RepID=A0A922CG27_MANSE|nr:hypothetical protein O3G_MSEX003234 [Manduca sexta]
MEKLIILFAAAVCVSGAFVPVTQMQGRIANGQLAAASQFNYSISLQLISEVGNYSTGHSCGGVLVTLSHALTAASCTFNRSSGELIPFDASEFRVFAGGVNLTNQYPDLFRDVANYTVHPQFVPPPASINDIAVLTLVAPFLATLVTPLALPSSNFAPADMSPCILAGWGSSTHNETGLRFTNKYIYNQALCTSVFASLPSTSNIFNTMVCAASLDIVSAGCPVSLFSFPSFFLVRWWNALMLNY